jgi:hypothetical protein
MFDIHGKRQNPLRLAPTVSLCGEHGRSVTAAVVPASVLVSVLPGRVRA